MPNLEVIIFNKKIKLSYQENEKQRLINAVENLNKNWKKYSKLHSKVSEFKIITLISLELQDSIEDYNILKNKISEYKPQLEKLKKTIEEKNIDFVNSLNTIDKLKIDIDKKNKEILKIENLLDEIHEELLQIKTNILVSKNE